METHSFGYWLRLKRKSLDLTRAGLADRVGCSVGTIQKLEEEERRPSAQIVGRLADIFEIPQDERSTFLRFARGEVRSAFTEAEDDLAWDTSLKRHRSNLPTTLNALIGRQKEIAEVRAYLLSADVRLVTLTGPPGIGKTRLSIDAARSALPDFSDAIYFVALTSVDNPTLIAVTVAQAMGYVGARDISTVDQLKEGIGDQHILMVLDNCEHLIEDIASLASSLLLACSHLKILATSREALRIPGEWVYQLQPLQIPSDDSLMRADNISDFPALTLFAERARAVQSNFQLNSENIKTISTICQQLDGLPLAIELIAARIRFLPPQTLLEQLHAQFLLSADGMRAVPTRQKSLNNAIDWSYRLLSNEEQRFFGYISVFSGGFTLDSAEAIFSRAFPEKSIAALITSLLDKSLLQRSIDSDSEPQYTMLTTIREFARQRLQEIDSEAEARDWHLEYFVDLAGQADHELRGPHQSEWLKRLHAIRDNLRAALDWAIQTGKAEYALALTRGLWWFWSKRSEFNEGRKWIEQVLNMPNAARFPDLYAKVLTQLAHHTCLQIGGKDAKPFIEQAVAIARTAHHRQTLAYALMVSGIILTYEENFSAARSTLEESLTLFQEMQDAWGIAVTIMTLGFSAYKRGDQAAALELATQALARFRELGDQYFQSVCLYEIGNLRARQGDWKEGLAELRESLILSRELGSNYEIAAGLFRLAEAEQRLEQPARAVKLFYAAKHVYSSIGAWQQEDDGILEKHLAPTRGLLSEAEFTTAVTEGQSMTIVQAIEYALELPGDHLT